MTSRLGGLPLAATLAAGIHVTSSLVRHPLPDLGPGDVASVCHEVDCLSGRVRMVDVVEVPGLQKLQGAVVQWVVPAEV